MCVRLCAMLCLVSHIELNCWPRLACSREYRLQLMTIVSGLTRSNQDSPIIEVIDPGFSDHRLLQWTCRLDRPLPVYRTTTGRSWRSIDTDNFTNLLCQSAISGSRSSEFTEPAVSVDELCELYTSEVMNIADSIAPSRTSTRRVRRSDPWFDEEFRAAKRECQKLERRARRSAVEVNLACESSGLSHSN